MADCCNVEHGHHPEYFSKKALPRGSRDEKHTSASFSPTSSSFSALLRMSCFTAWCRLSAVAYPSLKATCTQRTKVSPAHCAGNAKVCFASKSACTELCCSRAMHTSRAAFTPSGKVNWPDALQASSMHAYGMHQPDISWPPCHQPQGGYLGHVPRAVRCVRLA